jgi:hypothetical protein
MVKSQLASPAPARTRQTKGFVSGGGKKPGSRRVPVAPRGGNRSPIWAGGTIFGPARLRYQSQVRAGRPRSAPCCSRAHGEASSSSSIAGAVRPKTKRWSSASGLGVDGSALVLASPNRRLMRARNLRR